LYHWAISDVMPEDRPTQEEINSDKQFDAWLERFERKMAQLTSERQKHEREMAMRQHKGRRKVDA
jgi:hypothetical protein